MGIARKLILTPGKKAVVRLLRSLPFSSEILGPPKGHHPIARNWIDEPGHEKRGSYTVVLPKEELRRNPPRTVETIPFVGFARAERESVPEGYVVELREARLNRHSIIGEDDRILDDLSVTSFNHAVAHMNDLKLDQVVELRGRVAVLTEHCSGFNYSHWLLMGLGRVFAIQKKFPLESFDHFVFSPFQFPFHWQTIEQVGIPKEKVFQMRPGQQLKIKGLITANYRLHPDPFVMRSWNQLVPNLEKKKRRRLYVSRERAVGRRLTNEKDVLRIIEPLGFEKVLLEELTFLEQIKLFQNAECVLCPTGASLANIVFCSPGTKVIEIFCPNWLSIEFWKLCEMQGLEFYHLFGEGYQGIQDIFSLMSVRNFDITVPLAKLKATLELAKIS